MFNSIREISVLWLLKDQSRVLAISCSPFLKSRFHFRWRMSLNCKTGAFVASRRNQSKLLETLMIDLFFALVELFFLFTIALVCRTVLSTFTVVVHSLSVVVKTGWKLCRPLVFVETNQILVLLRIRSVATKKKFHVLKGDTSCRGLAEFRLPGIWCF